MKMSLNITASGNLKFFYPCIKCRSITTSAHEWFCGSRFSPGRLLATEYFFNIIFCICENVPFSHWNKNVITCKLRQMHLVNEQNIEKVCMYKHKYIPNWMDAVPKLDYSTSPNCTALGTVNNMSAGCVIYWWEVYNVLCG